MDYRTLIRMKRGQILAGMTSFADQKTLDRNDIIVRDLFAGNPVIVEGTQQNTVCCNNMAPPPTPNVPPTLVINECPRPRHQF